MNGEITQGWRAKVAAKALPGTNLTLKGEIKLVRIQGFWLICFRFDQLYLRQDVLLSDWLFEASGNIDHDLEPRNTLTGKQAAALSKRFPHASVRFPRGAVVAFQPLTPGATLFAHLDDKTKGLAADAYNVFTFNATDPWVQLGHSGLRVGSNRTVLAWSDTDLADRTLSGPYTWMLPAGALICSAERALSKAQVAKKNVEAWITDCSIRDGRLRFARGAAGRREVDALFEIGGRLRFEHALAHDWPELPFGQTEFRWTRTSSKADNVSLTGTAPKGGSLTRGSGITACVCPGEVEDFLISREGRITVLNWRAAMVTAFVPLENADYSRFNFADTTICAVIEGLGPDIRTTDFILSLGEVPQLKGILSNNASLYFHRSADLADLKVRFRNLTLLARPDGAEIDSLEEPVPGGKVADEDRPLLIFDLPPQQIAERTYLLGRNHTEKGLNLSKTKHAVPLDERRAYQVRESQGKKYTFEKAVKDPKNFLGDNQSKAREEREPKLDEIGVAVQMLDHLVEARAAGPTRIVLEIPQEPKETDAPRLPIRFSSDDLLKWDGFKTRASRRALPRNASIQDQLDVAGILKNTETDRKIEMIGNELDGLDQGRIGPEETKIEYPYDLHLSPRKDARWLTSPPPTDLRRARGMGLFWAQIDPAQGADSVRALWSRSFEAHMNALFAQDRPEDRELPEHSAADPARLIPGLGDAKHLPRRLFPWLEAKACKTKDFRLPMDIRDRFELVMLTSIYGLPSLLPEPNVVGIDGGPKKVTDRPAADPFIVPVPVRDGWQKGTGSLGEEGVFVPRPFSQFNFRLTALGATGFMTGEWEPPSGYLNLEGGSMAPEYPGLTIERVHDASFQGRHIEVEVVYKGFLFPFGHRCSIVKATDRGFTDDPDHLDRSVAPLVQRFFIVVGDPEKTIPALGMPFEGRACPGNSIRLLTTRTKEIEDPWDDDPATKLKDLGKDVLKGASAFHPYGLGEKAPLQFSFVIGYEDGTTSEEMTAPLIVVDNTFAHHPNSVRSLITAYNGDAEKHNIFNQAALGMQRVKYAAERAAGDTEFRTERWHLGVHPREITDPKLKLYDIAPYTMDAVMEGADQPPFYPCVASARIEVQSINVLNGKSGGLIKVAHDAHYLTHGFAKGINDAEIYLSLIEKNFIDTTQRKNASGGLATPNSKIVSLSRLKGPVGGSADNLLNTTDTLPRDKNSALTAIRNAPPGAGQLPASHQNKFDPLEYFGNALSNAKLFGTIPLKDVVRAISFIDGAPELLETVTRTFFDFQDDSKEAAYEVIDKVIGFLDAVRSEADEAWAKIGLDADDLYPALFAAIVGLKKDLIALRVAIAAFDSVTRPDTVAIVTATADVATGMKALEGHVRRVIANPTPAIVDEFITRAQETFKDLKQAGQDLALAVKEQLKGEIEALLTVEVCVEQAKIDPDKEEIIVDINWTQDQKDAFVLLSPILGLLPQDVYEEIRLNRPLLQDGTLPPFCQTFSLAEPDEVADAGREIDALRRRAQEALLYETVGKPLVDGYIALETFREKYSKEALRLEEAIKAFPQELLTVAETWLDGALRLNQMSALISDQIEMMTGQATDWVWGEVVEPAMCDVILPLVDPVLRKGVKLGQLSVEADNRIGKLVTRVRGLIQKAPTPELRGQLQQVLSGLAQGQKQLREATAELRGTITAIALPPGGKESSEPSDVYYLDLNFRYDSNKEKYLKPLKTRFYAASRAGPAAAMLEINGQIGRLILRKEQAFRAARDVIRQSAEAVQLADILATNAERFVPASGIRSASIARARSIVKKDVDEIRDETTALVREVGSIVQAVFSNGALTNKQKVKELNDRLQAAKERFKETAQRVTDIQNIYEDHSANLTDALKEMNSATTDNYRNKTSALASAVDGIVAYTFGEERMMAGLAGQAFALIDDGKGQIQALENQAAARIGAALLPVAKNALSLLIRLNRQAKKAREGLKPSSEYEPILKLFLAPKVYEALFHPLALKPLEDEHSELKASLDALEALPSKLSKTDLLTAQGEIENIYNLVRDWIDGTKNPAVIAAFAPLAAVFDTVTKGRIGELIDFGGLERALREALLEFIPSEIYTDLGWATTIDPFPSDAGKFFWIERKLRKPQKLPKLTEEFLERRKKEKLQPANPDLVIASRAGVRLNPDLKPEPYFRVESHIFDPSVKLFGDSFHVVTIQLEHVRFVADELGTDLDVRIRPELVGPRAGIIFGPIVEYIASLAEAFGGLLPPWLKVRPDLPGVSAEFGFPAFSVSIGTMSILNLSVNIEIEVPFSNLPITSRFRLAHRDRPFMISFAPYGGGGYVGLITRSTDIVGFELQLEFGAVVGLAFPPFNGYGAVMAGIYIEQQQGRDLIIAGFVRAIGEGTLGIFSIAVHIEVRVTGQGENVTGSAKFAFTFKVKIVSITISFEAAYAFAGGDGGDNRQVRSDPELSGLTDETKRSEHTITVDVPEPQMRGEWAAYRNLFLD